MQAQTSMEVHQKDGTTVSIPIDRIDNVTFGERELEKLDNQYDIKGDIQAIGSVVATKGESNYVFSLYTEEGITQADATPAMKLTIPAEELGNAIDLATADPETVSVQIGEEKASLTGTLTVSFDKFKLNAIIALEANDAYLYPVRAAYRGGYTLNYASSNTFSVTPVEGTPASYTIPAVLRVKPAAAGQSVGIAFSDVEATNAEGMLQGSHAVWFTLAASKFNSSIDLAADKESYTMKFIDYATGTVYENIASGSLTTEQITDEKVYFKLEATLEDGTAFAADFYGTATDVESLDAMIPNPVLPNVFCYYNADGEQASEEEIVTVKYEKTTDGFHKLYFLQENGSTMDNYNTPQLQFSDALVNVGNIDLANLQANVGFSIKFKTIQLSSPDDKYGGYSPVPDNGTLNIAYDEATGTYTVYLEATNSYNMPAMEGYHGGDNTKVVISYKGTTEPK